MLFPDYFPIEFLLSSDCHFGSNQNSSSENDLSIYMHAAHSTLQDTSWCTISIGNPTMRKSQQPRNRCSCLNRWWSQLFGAEEWRNSLLRNYARMQCNEPDCSDPGNSTHFSVAAVWLMNPHHRFNELEIAYNIECNRRVVVFGARARKSTRLL